MCVYNLCMNCVLLLVYRVIKGGDRIDMCNTSLFFLFTKWVGILGSEK